MLNDNKVFLLIDLLGDISDLNKEKGLEPVATSTKSLCKEWLKQILKKTVLSRLLGDGWWHTPQMSTHAFISL